MRLLLPFLLGVHIFLFSRTEGVIFSHCQLKIDSTSIFSLTCNGSLISTKSQTRAEWLQACVLRPQACTVWVVAGRLFYIIYSIHWCIYFANILLSFLSLHSFLVRFLFEFGRWSWHWLQIYLRCLPLLLKYLTCFFIY